jgi:hypothetical protein
MVLGPLVMIFLLIPLIAPNFSPVSTPFTPVLSSLSRLCWVCLRHLRGHSLHYSDSHARARTIRLASDRPVSSAALDHTTHNHLRPGNGHLDHLKLRLVT